MKKTVEEINKMIMEDAPMEEINDAIGSIDIYSCFDPIFEPVSYTHLDVYKRQTE